MAMHKGYFDKIKCMHFIVFLKIFEKVSNIIEKKLKVSLYIIKLSKSRKEIQHKRELSMFLYTSNIVSFRL